MILQILRAWVRGERTAHHREILGEDGDRATFDATEACHHAIARDLLTGVGVHHQRIDFFEAALVQKGGDAFPGRELATLVLLLDAGLTATLQRRLVLGAQSIDLHLKGHSNS